MDQPLFEVRDLHVSTAGKEIVKGLNLKVMPGEMHVIMGPNGSGKSTFAFSVNGHPKYQVTKGDVLIDGENVTSLRADEKAQRGMFLAFQYPAEIPGVKITNFLKASYNSTHKQENEGKGVSVFEFKKIFDDTVQQLGMDSKLTQRYLNEGFSGGEKKRSEILQMSVLRPRIAILDEIDSGLDIDAVKAVAEGIQKNMDASRSVIIITHYQRILNYLNPDKIHIMLDGKIARSGGNELVQELEEKGYDWLKETKTVQEEMK